MAIPNNFQLKDFSYSFSEELIASHPLENRDASRLMVLNRQTQEVAHKKFSEITDYFQKGDVLVFNDSKVFPCRLVTTRKTGGRQEILLIRRTSPSPWPSPQRGEGKVENWEVILNANKKVHKDDQFKFENLHITILDDPQDENNFTRQARLEYTGELLEILNRLAQIPLPPYFNREADESDKTRYQTIYAKDTGSVAAPTAGLHFTPKILEALKTKGVILTYVTLHVGPGTFLPVRSDDIREHKMHTEFFSISQEACDVINLAKKEKRLVTAVGTTSVRVLESIRAGHDLPLRMQTGQTNIFIYPPYEFKIVDRLITNFHQPESTLLMLVAAFAGREFVLSAYQEAIKEKYRLFSYGDSMLII